MKAVVVVVAMLFVTLAAPARAQHAETGASDPPPSTRLFLMPTGHTLTESHGYFDVFAPGLAHLQMAGNDWFSLGGGTPAYIVGGVSAIWITPKLAVAKTSHVHAAVGAVQFFASGTAGGLAYAVATTGSRDRAVTIGFLNGYGDASGVGPAVMLGLEQARSRHLRLMVEATIFRSGGLVIAGVRRSGKKFTSDFGMAVPIPFSGDVGLIAFPMVNFGWKF